MGDDAVSTKNCHWARNFAGILHLCSEILSVSRHAHCFFVFFFKSTMCFSTPGMPMSFTCSRPTLLMPWGSTTARRTRLFLSRQYEVDILCFKQNKKIVWFEFSLFAHAEQLMSSPIRRLPESLSTLSPKTQIHPLNSSQRMSWRKPSGEDQVREWLNTEYPKALSSAS